VVGLITDRTKEGREKDAGKSRIKQICFRYHKKRTSKTTKLSLEDGGIHVHVVVRLLFAHDQRRLLALEGELAISCEIELERLGIVVKAKALHRPQDVVAVDCFPFLLLTSVAGLARDKALK